MKARFWGIRPKGSTHPEIPEWLTLAEASLVTGLDIAAISEIIREQHLATRALGDSGDQSIVLVSRDALARAGLIEELAGESRVKPPRRDHWAAYVRDFRPFLSSRLGGMTIGALIAFVTISYLPFSGLPSGKGPKTRQCPDGSQSKHCLEALPSIAPLPEASLAPSPSPSPSPSESEAPSPSPSPVTDPVESACSGVVVTPGSAATIQQILNNRPSGTTFCFKAGVYHWREMLVVPSYSRLVAEPGTVITGDDLYPATIGGYGYETGQHDVTVKGFVVERSTAISGIRAGWRWTIVGNEVRYNHDTGIRGNRGNVIRGNHVHHNRLYGVTEGGPGMVVEGNEISFNNTSRRHIEDEGGTKFTKTDGMVFRNNYVHDNYGDGIWFDWDNTNIVIEGNRVENNELTGIFYEVSYNGIIRNNTLKGNGRTSGGSLWTPGQIYLNDSQNVQIYGNVIDTAAENAISLSDVTRDGTSVYSANKRTANVSIHDNTIIIRGAGMVGLVGRSSALSDGNRFDRNTYRVFSTACGCFYWNGTLNYNSWRTTGNDTNGSMSWL